MKFKKKGLLIFSVLITALLGTAIVTRAGWIQVERDNSTTLISKGKFKNITDEGWTVFDAGRGEMTMGKSEQRIYAKGTVDDYCKTIKAMQEEMMKNIPQEHKAMMEQMMVDMPPEQRKMMEQMMGKADEGAKGMPNDQTAGKTSPEVSVEKAGSGGVIAGFKTDKYNIMVDGRLYKEVWLATDASLLKEMGEQRKKALLLGQKLEECMAITGGVEPDMPENSPEYIEMELKGWVMKEMKDGNVEIEVIKLEKKSIQDSAFQPPAGYKKVSISGMFEVEMGE